MDREYLASGMGRTAAELREQLSIMTAAGQLLERTAGEREKEYLASINRSICRMLRTVGRMELAHRLTDENEIRTFPELMDLGPWAASLAERTRDVLALIDVAVEWEVPSNLLINADKRLLEHMVLEMINEVLEGGDRIGLTLSRQGDKVRFGVSVGGTGTEPVREPDGLDNGEEPLGVAMIRQVAQLHGGTLITCLEGGRCKSLTAILPQRMDLPAGRLESPRMESAPGGFDRVLVAFSHRLPSRDFLPEEN